MVDNLKYDKLVELIEGKIKDQKNTNKSTYQYDFVEMIVNRMISDTDIILKLIGDDVFLDKYSNNFVQIFDSICTTFTFKFIEPYFETNRCAINRSTTRGIMFIYQFFPVVRRYSDMKPFGLINRIERQITKLIERKEDDEKLSHDIIKMVHRIVGRYKPDHPLFDLLMYKDIVSAFCFEEPDDICAYESNDEQDEQDWDDQEMRLTTTVGNLFKLFGIFYSNGVACTYKQFRDIIDMNIAPTLNDDENVMFMIHCAKTYVTACSAKICLSKIMQNGYVEYFTELIYCLDMENRNNISTDVIIGLIEKRVDDGYRAKECKIMFGKNYNDNKDFMKLFKKMEPSADDLKEIISMMFRCCDLDVYEYISLTQNPYDELLLVQAIEYWTTKFYANTEVVMIFLKTLVEKYGVVLSRRITVEMLKAYQTYRNKFMEQMGTVTHIKKYETMLADNKILYVDAEVLRIAKDLGY
jgi:hypothetical protein